MKTRADLPEVGVVFWHVGNGDSNTLLLGERPDGTDVILQVDVHHMTKSADETDSTVLVIDQLIEILPEVDGRPYLAAFALTHPDEDHCKGFKDLLDRVVIGELWLTPRGFDDYDDDLCEDAVAFCEEAERRLAKAVSGDLTSGHRIRVIGRAERFDEPPYSKLPESTRTTAGTAVTEVDGHGFDGVFRAFIHAPLLEADDGDCNDSSLAMQVTLTDDDNDLRLMLFGDLAHESIAQIFEKNKDPENVQWDIMLAAHHCSKKALYDDDDVVDADVVDGLTTSAASGGWIVASSRLIPARDEPGDDPPHRLARDKYAEIVDADHVLCTADHGSVDDPDPIEFSASEAGLYKKPAASSARTALGAAVAAARPRPAPPRDRTGYGVQ